MRGYLRRLLVFAANLGTTRLYAPNPWPGSEPSIADGLRQFVAAHLREHRLAIEQALEAAPAHRGRPGRAPAHTRGGAPVSEAGGADERRDGGDDHHPQPARPPQRAVAGVVRRALAEALAAARDDDEVRAVVLTDAGRGFCAGADLAGDDPNPPLTRTVQKSPIQQYTQVTMLIERLDKPIIAAVNGPAAGAGLSYATACDRRIAAASARFAAIFVRRGLVPDCGISYYLPRLIGLGRATDLLITGAVIDADTALRIGLVEEVCPDDDLTERAHAYAAALARGASIAIDLSPPPRPPRARPRPGGGSRWSRGRRRSSMPARTCASAAFLERREPRFKGR
ncbi:MAG: enoyl-CoA hydratase/isomerase family protein [Dehalococcoidia bacterium]